MAPNSRYSRALQADRMGFDTHPGELRNFFAGEVRRAGVNPVAARVHLAQQVSAKIQQGTGQTNHDQNSLVAQCRSLSAECSNERRLSHYRRGSTAIADRRCFRSESNTCFCILPHSHLLLRMLKFQPRLKHQHIPKLMLPIEPTGQVFLPLAAYRRRIEIPFALQARVIQQRFCPIAQRPA